MRFTKEQQAVVQSNEQKILVKAGAGTGKTEVLTQRILHLIDIEPTLSIKDIAIITFTNKATEELQARLKKAFYQAWKKERHPKKKERYRYEIEALNSVQISTIHSFCRSILESIGPYSDGEVIYSPNFKVASDQLSITIDRTLEMWINSKHNSKKQIEHLKYIPVHFLNKIIKEAFTMIRSKGFDLDEILQGTRITSFEDSIISRKLKRELIEIIKAVSEEQKKYKTGTIDTDDLLEYCTKILKNREDLREMVKKKYKYIFIDEFQDTSLYQTELVKMICDESDNSPALFVVGDIKQSIYEFRGANPDAYSEIESWIKQHGKILPLSINWRSKPEIVEYVNLVFERIENNDLYQFKHEPLKPSLQKEVLHLTNAYDWILADQNQRQENLIAKYIRDKKEQGENIGRYTILVRRNFEIDSITTKLLEYGIEPTVVDSGRFYNQKEIIDTYLVLKSIINPGDLIIAKEAQETIFFNNYPRDYDALINKIKEERLHYTFTCSQLIDYIYKSTKIFDRCSSKTKANLNKLKAITRKLVVNEHFSLNQYIHWLFIRINNETEEPLADSIAEKEQTVQIMTIHKAKGLQFPAVILPNLDQNISSKSLNPKILINQSKNSLEFHYKKYYDQDTILSSTYYKEANKSNQFSVYSEELRVLYVALTRAEEKLILCGKKDLSKSKICYQNWLRQD